MHVAPLLSYRFSLSWTILHSRTRARPWYERRNFRGLSRHALQIKPRGIMLPWTYESVAWSGDRANIGELGFLRAFNPPYFLFLTPLSSYRRAADWFSKLRLGLKVRKNTIIRRWNSRVQRKQPRDRESVQGKCRTRKSLPVLRASVQRHANLFLHRIPPCIFIIDFASTAGTRVKEGTDNRERDDEARHADRCAGALTSDSVAQLSSVDDAMERQTSLVSCATLHR